MNSKLTLGFKVDIICLLQIPPSPTQQPQPCSQAAAHLPGHSHRPCVPLASSGLEHQDSAGS